jgi:phosphoribosylpyrophosphate synthetase
MFQAASAAKKQGAKKVIGLVTHFYGFDSPTQGSFDARLAASDLDELVCTNTRGGLRDRLEKSETLRSRLTVLDIAPYLAQAMSNCHTGGTVKDMITRVSDLRDFYRLAHVAGESKVDF